MIEARETIARLEKERDDARRQYGDEWTKNDDLRAQLATVTRERDWLAARLESEHALPVAALSDEGVAAVCASLAAAHASGLPFVESAARFLGYLRHNGLAIVEVPVSEIAHGPRGGK